MNRIVTLWHNFGTFSTIVNLWHWHAIFHYYSNESKLESEILHWPCVIISKYILESITSEIGRLTAQLIYFLMDWYDIFGKVQYQSDNEGPEKWHRCSIGDFNRLPFGNERLFYFEILLFNFTYNDKVACQKLSISDEEK